MEEKRGYSRFQFNEQIVLKTAKDEEFAVEIKNLSLKGGAIHAPEECAFSIGDTLAFSLFFSKDETIVINGIATIAWKNDSNTYGLSFNRMDDTYFMSLKRLLELYHGEK